MRDEDSTMDRLNRKRLFILGILFGLIVTLAIILIVEFA
jgi:hypothetical protein